MIDLTKAPLAKAFLEDLMTINYCIYLYNRDIVVISHIVVDF